MLEIFHNASWNRYDNKNPSKSAYISSIDKISFRLDFKPSIDSREIEVIYIDDLPYIFEDHFIIAVINIFDVLDIFETDRNEFILINTESTSIHEDLHENSVGFIEVNNILYELRCII